MKIYTREMITMIFCDKDHETAYYEILNRMKYTDCYHRSVAYLFALDTVIRKQTDEVFNFQDDGIKCDGLHKSFQTGTSRKTTRLAFNLWNGCADDGETYIDDDGYKSELPSRYYAPDEIFCCSYAPYYWQAIQIRFGIE